MLDLYPSFLEYPAIGPPVVANSALPNIELALSFYLLYSTVFFPLNFGFVEFYFTLGYTTCS